MNPTAAHSNLLTHIHKIGLTHIYRFKKILLKKPNVKIVFQNEIVKESLINLLMSDQKTQKRASISPSAKTVMLSALYWDVSAEKVSLWF